MDNYEADSIRYFFIANGPEKKDAINEIFEFVRNSVQIIANLAVLLSPFLPFSSEKVLKWLNTSSRWERQHVASGYLLPEVEILFQRLDTVVSFCAWFRLLE